MNLLCLKMCEDEASVFIFVHAFPWLYLYEFVCVSCPELTGILQQAWIKGMLAVIDAFPVR